MDSASALRRAARGCRWGLELPDLEDLGPTVRARTLDRGAAVLHGHLLRVLDLHLLAFLDAVTLWHHRTSFGGSMRCGECEVTASDGQRTPTHVPIRTRSTHGSAKRPLPRRGTDCPAQRRVCCLQTRSCRGPEGGEASRSPGRGKRRAVVY